MALEKLGLHIIYPYGYRGLLRGPLGAPRVVKLLDPSVADVGDVRSAVGDNCLIVVRFYVREQVLTPDAARAHYYARMGQMMAMRVVAGPNVAFELYNEVPSEQVDALARAELAWLELMHAQALRAVVGNFAVGHPYVELWERYKPVIEALTAGDLLGMHDYWAYGEDISNPWYVGRWRNPAAPGWLHGVPIVVTECGRDVIEDRARYGRDIGKAGWRLGCDWDTYLSELERYHGEVLARSENVLGATVFQAGAADRRWQAFDVAEHWVDIVCRYSETQPKPKPEPVEPLAYPVPGARISQRFGERREAYWPRYEGHPGIDLAPPAGVAHMEWHGTPVRATIAGTAYVVRPAENAGYGIYVYIKGREADELLAHLADAHDEVNGQEVEAGDVVGYAGYSGNCEPVGVRGCHVHWGIRPRPYDMGNGYRGYVDPLSMARAT